MSESLFQPSIRTFEDHRMSSIFEFLSAEHCRPIESWHMKRCVIEMTFKSLFLCVDLGSCDMQTLSKRYPCSESLHFASGQLFQICAFEKSSTHVKVPLRKRFCLRNSLTVVTQRSNSDASFCFWQFSLILLLAFALPLFLHAPRTFSTSHRIRRHVSERCLITIASVWNHVESFSSSNRATWLAMWNTRSFKLLDKPSKIFTTSCETTLCSNMDDSHCRAPFMQWFKSTSSFNDGKSSVTVIQQQKTS